MTLDAARFMPHLMPLFDGEKDPRADLVRLAATTRDALAEEEFDDRFRLLFDLVSDGMAWRLVRHLRAGRLPPAALELAAGAGGIAIGKLYAVRPAWEAARALRRGRPPFRKVPSVPELEARIEKLEARLRDGDGSTYDHDEDAVSVAYAERTIAELLGKRTNATSPSERASLDARLEDARWDLAEASGRETEHALSPALERAVARAGPIGAGHSRVSVCADDRIELYEGRGSGPAWEAVRLAIDACAGGSHAALESLDRFARTHEALGWPLWLDEVACGIAGLPRGQESARRLDAYLVGDPYAVKRIEWFREHLAATLVPARDVWLTLAARRETGFDPPESFTRSLLDERARLDAGLPGRMDRELFQMIERTMAESDRSRRESQERAGPFFDLRIDPPLEKVFDGPLHYMFLAFRMLYGTELVRGALLALAN